MHYDEVCSKTFRAEALTTNLIYFRCVTPQDHAQDFNQLEQPYLKTIDTTANSKAKIDISTLAKLDLT